MLEALGSIVLGAIGVVVFLAPGWIGYLLGYDVFTCEFLAVAAGGAIFVLWCIGDLIRG